MKYCSQCGAPNPDESKFCSKCGAPFKMNAGQSSPTASSYNTQAGQTQAPYGNQPTNPSAWGITERSIPICVILSIVTCGIYSLYWFVKINNEINQLAGEPEATSGGMALLFTIITCDIYGIYWAYRMGQRSDRIHKTDGYAPILYLILQLFGLGIINYCLLQDTINKQVRQR